MLRIRLTKVGRKNAPAYRIVVIDRKSKRDGKAKEVIGHYNPSEDPKKVTYQKDRYEYWVSVGAQASTAVRKLIANKYEYIPYDAKAKAKEAQDAKAESAEIKAEDAKNQIAKESEKKETEPSKGNPKEKSNESKSKESSDK